MRRRAGHETRPHDRLPPIYLGMGALMTSQLKIALFGKLRGPLMCLAYFLASNSWVFAQPGTDRRPVDSCRNKISVLYVQDPYDVHS